MEIRENATCAVGDREFNISVSEAEIRRLYHILARARDVARDEDLIEDLIVEIEHAAGVTPEMK